MIIISDHLDNKHLFYQNKEIKMCYRHYMADHADVRSRRSVVNPGTTLWRPPVEVTQFCRPFYVRLKKIILIKRRENSMNQKLLKMIQVIVWRHTDEFIFVWFYTNENGRGSLSYLGAQG